MRLNRNVPINGTRVALGPFPFTVKAVTLVNQCQSGNLIVLEDSGTQYVATPATAETWSTGPTLQLTAYIDSPQTAGALTVVVSDTEPSDAVSSNQLASLASIGSNVQRVTSLPATPFDGQVISLAVDQVNFPGLEWLFIYNTATGYWDFLGGNPIDVYAAPGGVINSGTQIGATGYYWQASMAKAAPFAGDYFIDGDVLFNANGTFGIPIDCVPFAGAGFAGSFTDGADEFNAASATVVKGKHSRGKVVGATLGLNLGMVATSGALGTTKIQNVRFAITPIRIH